MPILKIKSKALGAIDVLVSEEDVERLALYRWCPFPRRKVVYVRGTVGDRAVLLHRFITDCPAGMTVDHIDGNPLNNTRENLRVCTYAENVAFAWDRDAYRENLDQAKRVNVVSKRLADGSIKTYTYARKPWKTTRGLQTK